MALLLDDLVTPDDEHPTGCGCVECDRAQAEADDHGYIPFDQVVEV